MTQSSPPPPEDYLQTGMHHMKAALAAITARWRLRLQQRVCRLTAANVCRSLQQRARLQMHAGRLITGGAEIQNHLQTDHQTQPQQNLQKLVSSGEPHR